MDIGRPRSSGREPLSSINVTPLVDVMLVLLIIFMVTASMGQQGITVNLPKASAATLNVTEDTITVSIDAGLQVFVNAALVPQDQLTARLQALYSHRKNKAIFLKSDKSVAYGDFVKIVSLIKASGVEQLGMLTEPVEK
jgi:biopolymer transport protein TolR